MFIGRNRNEKPIYHSTHRRSDRNRGEHKSRRAAGEITWQQREDLLTLVYQDENTKLQLAANLLHDWTGLLIVLVLFALSRIDPIDPESEGSE